MTASRILDERSEPPLRAVIGKLLASCGRADLALGRVRLGSLDLTPAEVQGPERCRVLLGQLDASTLLDTAPHRGSRPPAMARLATWLASERLEVRSAGIGAWTPDFSVYSSSPGLPGREGAREQTTTCLLGAHYFGNPQLTVGPSVTVVLHDRDTARVLRRRFDELWDQAHDVSAAIMEVLERGA